MHAPAGLYPGPTHAVASTRISALRIFLLSSGPCCIRQIYHFSFLQQVHAQTLRSSVSDMDNLQTSPRCLCRESSCVDGTYGCDLRLHATMGLCRLNRECIAGTDLSMQVLRIAPNFDLFLVFMLAVLNYVQPFTRAPLCCSQCAVPDRSEALPLEDNDAHSHMCYFAIERPY